MNRRALGKQGEQHAVDYLLKQGYEIVERNFQVRGGEIDLIARKGRVLSFLEVKSWKVYTMQDLEHVMNEKKRARMIQVSRLYLQRHTEYDAFEIRYDVIFLDGSEQVLMLENAFMRTGMV